MVMEAVELLFHLGTKILEIKFLCFLIQTILNNKLDVLKA